jgi:hypothetical protein
VLVCSLDLVILCPEIAARREEVDVVVGVVVLLKLDRRKLEPSKCVWCRNGSCNLIKFLLIIKCATSSLVRIL